MMPVIRIDDDVFAALQERGETFVDTPNSVLRRVLGLDGASQEDAAEDVKTEVDSRASTVRKSQMRTGRNRASRGRMSDQSDREWTVGRRASSRDLLPLEAYTQPILESLAELGGESPADKVIELVGKKLDAKLTLVDRQEYSSGMVRWKNRTQWQRSKLVEQGLLDGDAPRGIWRLTDKGTEEAEQ